MKKKIFIAAVILVLLAVFLTIFALRKKSTPVSDADLALVRINVSSNENAFHILEKAAVELAWPENTKDVNKIIEWESWDANLAAEIFSSNQKTLELFDRALLYPRLQVPEIQSFGEDFRYFESWKQLSQLSVLRSIALFRAGKEKDALDSTLQVVEFGHRIEDSDGTLIHYLVGSAVKNMALHTMQRLIGNSPLSCDSMRSYADKLEPLYANESALTNVIKTEYQLQSKYVDDMASGKAIGITNRNTQSGGRFFGTVFDPQETREIYAQFARTGLQSIEHTFSNMPTNPVSFSTNRSMFSFLFSGNAVGQILAQMSLSPSQKFVSRKCRENVNVAATQTIIALKCYEEKHGSLPSSLEELVPEFLSKIPIDDFDGKPLRYSAEKKIIYSVGEDLIDSGGEEKDAKKKPLDILFKIKF